MLAKHEIGSGSFIFRENKSCPVSSSVPLENYARFGSWLIAHVLLGDF